MHALNTSDQIYDPYEPIYGKKTKMGGKHSWNRKYSIQTRKPKFFYITYTPAIAVVLDIMHTERCTLATSPPGTTVGG